MQLLAVRAARGRPNNLGFPRLPSSAPEIGVAPKGSQRGSPEVTSTTGPTLKSRLWTMLLVPMSPAEPIYEVPAQSEADRAGTSNIGPRPKSEPEQWNIFQFRALAALFRAQFSNFGPVADDPPSSTQTHPTSTLDVSSGHSGRKWGHVSGFGENSRLRRAVVAELFPAPTGLAELSRGGTPHLGFSQNIRAGSRDVRQLRAMSAISRLELRPTPSPLRAGHTRPPDRHASENALSGPPGRTQPKMRH